MGFSLSQHYDEMKTGAECIPEGKFDVIENV